MYYNYVKSFQEKISDEHFRISQFQIPDVFTEL